MSHSLPTTADTVFQEEIEYFVDTALAEEGVMVDSIEVDSWENRANTTVAICVDKQINTEVRRVRKKISFSMIDPTSTRDVDHLRKQLATLAREIAKEFEDVMVTSLDVCGTTLDFCPAEGGWAACKGCGKQVSLSDTMMSLGFATEAELSNPSPTPYSVERFLQKLDSADKEVLKLYLFGSLRRVCTCDFGKRSDYLH